MAANVDSPKRRSLRLQDARVAAEDGPASTSSGSRKPAEPRTTSKAETLSSEKRRIDTEGQKGSSGKRRSAEVPRSKQGPMNGGLEEENDTGQGPRATRTSTGKKGDSFRGAPSMESNAAKTEDKVQPGAATSAPSMKTEAKSADTSHSPGGDHGKHTRPRRNHGNHSDKSPRGATTSAPLNTSSTRKTRSSKAKDPGSSPAVSGRGEGGTSSKEKKVKAHVTEPSFEKEQGSESAGGSSGHDRSLRSRRSRDGPSTVGESSSRGGSATKRETRSSSGRSSEASSAIRGKSKEKMGNADVAEVNSQIGESSEDPGGSSSHDRSSRSRRSREGSSLNVANSPKGATLSMFSRKTRASGAKDLDEPGVSTAGGEGVVSSKQKHENPDLVGTSTQRREGSGEPGGSSSHERSLRSRRSHEGSSSKGATSFSFSRKTRASGAKDLDEPGVSTAGGEGAVSSKQKHENPDLAGTSTQRREGSEEPRGSSSHDGSVQPSSTTVNVEYIPRGAAVSSSFRQTRSSRGKDREEVKDSTAVKDAVSSMEEKENGHLAEQESEGCGGSNSHNSNLLRLRSHKVSRFKGDNSSRGPSSPSKSQDLTTKEVGTSSQKDYEGGGRFSAAKSKDSDALLGKGEGVKGERVIRPSNQSGETLEVSGGVRSPAKSSRPRRSHDGSVTSGEVNNRGGVIPSKKKTEPIIQIGELSGVRGGYISPRKNLRTNRNLEHPSANDRPHPSNVDSESNTGEAARDYKVRCCSKQLLQEVLGMCTGICKEILDSQQYLNEEQKQQHHKNFVRDFETAFQENVRINGLSWHEAPDQDSEPDIKILEDQLDEAMVETSMKRKRYPRKILSHFVKSLKTEREILSQYKPVVNPVKVSLDPALELRMKDLSATAATVSQHIHETKKALPIQLEKAEGFSQVLSLQPVLEASRIRNNIFYSRVVIEDISKRIPKILETTPIESEPQKLSTLVRSLRKRKSSLPQRHLYPVQSKRKISLDS